MGDEQSQTPSRCQPLRQSNVRAPRETDERRVQTPDNRKSSKQVIDLSACKIVTVRYKARN